MEADSTTYDNNIKDLENETNLPFSTGPGNIKLYNKLTENSEGKNVNLQIIEKLQEFGLIPESISCPTNTPKCKVIKKSARVIDRVQWVCEECGKKQPIRTGSFFLRLQCSIRQVLQITLAWCEDADLAVAAEYFGVKTNIATQIYNKLEDMAIKELSKCLLGGENSVVMAELYPDCVNRLSPDTTDQPHVHRILMIADTKHIPTRYRLTVIKDPKKDREVDDHTIKLKVSQIISEVCFPNSVVVVSNSLPTVEESVSINQLLQLCDVDMQRFLTSKIWSQAVCLCAASRDICANASSATWSCADAVQRYLDTALYRLQYNDGFYEHTLNMIVNEYTDRSTIIS